MFSSSGGERNVLLHELFSCRCLLRAHHVLLGKLGQCPEAGEQLAVSTLLLGFCLRNVALRGGLRTDPRFVRWRRRVAFPRQSPSGSWGNIGSALLGGLIFNAALILLVKAIDMVGLAVAFPVCNGLSIALGTTVNYLVAPKGSPFWILGGIALITLAVLANAQAGRLKALQTSQTLKPLKRLKPPSVALPSPS